MRSQVKTYREANAFSQKEKIQREKEKNNVIPLLKDKMLFNSKYQHEKTKKLIKKKTYPIYLSI